MRFLSVWSKQKYKCTFHITYSWFGRQEIMQRFPQTECLTKIISTLVIQFSIKKGKNKDGC